MIHICVFFSELGTENHFIKDSGYDEKSYDGYLIDLEAYRLDQLARKSPQEITIAQLNKTIYGYDKHIISSGIIEWIREDYGFGNMLVGSRGDLVHVSYFFPTEFVKGDYVTILSLRLISRTDKYTRNGVQIEIPSVHVKLFRGIQYYRW